MKENVINIKIDNGSPIAAIEIFHQVFKGSTVSWGRLTVESKLKSYYLIDF
jgi:hypothetical protein